MGNGSNGHVTRVPALDRLWASVDVRGPDECWPFTGSTNAHGYGKFWLDGETLLAHRAVMILLGRDPGPVTRHTCDNPPCCNPAHLVGGNQQANVADCVAKGRTPMGTRNWNAKITDDDVRAIRARVAAGEQQRAVARAYGLAPGRISEIVNHKSWRHI